MMEALSTHWNKSTFTQKFSLVKRTTLQLCLLSVLAIGLFWLLFVSVWGLALLVGVAPYYIQQTPVFHVRPLLPGSLLSLYVNNNIKAELCQLDPQDQQWSHLTVPYAEYCNIEQEALPGMRGLVDVGLEDVDSTAVEYVTGCIKYRGRETSCQKYPAQASMQVLRGLDLQQLFYMQIELNLRSGHQGGAGTPGVVFEEKVWFVTRLIKDYYSVLSLVFALVITGMVCVGVVVLRLAGLARQLEEQSRSRVTESKARNAPVRLPAAVKVAVAKQEQSNKIKGFREQAEKAPVSQKQNKDDIVQKQKKNV